MPGRQPKVDYLREKFINSASSAQSLVDSVLGLSGINPNSESHRLHTGHARRVVELAFLGLVSARKKIFSSTPQIYSKVFPDEDLFSP